MLLRERFIRAVTFQPVDRVPLIEWPIRGSTMAAWISQGYPQGISPTEYFNLDTSPIEAPVELGMYPKFKEKLLEHDEHYKIWRDELGAVRKDFINDDTPGFVTRSWLKFAVEDAAGFKRMKKRYDPANEARYEKLTPLRAQALNAAHVPVQLSVPFLFWTARDWMGFEGLCYAFYDAPELVEEMFSFITEFAIQALGRVFKTLHVDVVELHEDMAYKHAPMISPEMFRKYMMPHYIRMVDFLHANGVKYIYVDCDGYPGDLIPLWIEAGINGWSPIEIAAGNDIIKLRGEYPTLTFTGGIDKRELAKDKRAVYDEVASKVPYLLEKGGYIPHVDHAIPPDVPLTNYLYYRDLLTRAAYGEQLGPRP
mgnify:CR=1 FL=1